MRPMSRRTLFVFVVLALLLPACAARQDNGSADLLDPNNSARQEFVADVQLNAGRVVQAVQGYDKALVARPGEASLLVKKGQALLRLNQSDAALATFRLALATSPDSSGAYYGAGLANERLGKGGEALQDFGHAVALAPTSWRARCHYGVLLMNQGLPDQAREQFLVALALPQVQGHPGAPAGPGREELLNNLAVAQVLSGDPEAAVTTFGQALQNSSDHERSANNLGLLLVRLGRPVEALNAFRASGNDARALNNLGYALYLRGEVPRAQALFEKALDLSPAYYETAGENLKQAVQGGTSHGRVGAGALGKGAGASEVVGQGMALKNTSGSVATPAADSPGAARVSLSGQSGVFLRFGPGSLREAAE